ncbi:MAG: hypothetical protein IJ955_05615 [Oscillospiraceae bacterium]|nr:hypothetical protein [Oscillospiraceae bacterium]
MILGKENGSVRQKIGHFTVGRCRNSGSGQGKRELGVFRGQQATAGREESPTDELTEASEL